MEENTRLTQEITVSALRKLVVSFTVSPSACLVSRYLVMSARRKR